MLHVQKYNTYLQALTGFSCAITRTTTALWPVSTTTWISQYWKLSNILTYTL